MTSRIAVVVNRDGGTAKRAGAKLENQIEAAFDAAGRSIDLRLVAGRELGAEVRRLAGQGDVAVGGGDGTLGSAAQAIAKVGRTLGILPLGTRNHLARQLGIPLDLSGAAQVIADGTRHAVDLGEVNGRMFVNNASIGLYPQLVEVRDRHWAPKWLANLPAAWTVLKRLRHHRLSITMEGKREVVRTPLLFVGNNEYSLDPGSLGQRRTLSDGKLSVFAIAGHDRIGLIATALRTVRGRADLDRDFATLGLCTMLTVNAHQRSISIALDGEVCRMATPLKFAIRPAALKVFVPSA